MFDQIYSHKLSITTFVATFAYNYLCVQASPGESTHFSVPVRIVQFPISIKLSKKTIRHGEIIEPLAFLNEEPGTVT